MLSDIATVNSQFGRAAAIAEIIETLTNNGVSSARPRSRFCFVSLYKWPAFPPAC